MALGVAGPLLPRKFSWAYKVKLRLQTHHRSSSKEVATHVSIMPATGVFSLPDFLVSELKVLLTIKLWPTAPMVDLILCCKNVSPISEASSLARGEILDTVVLVTTVADHPPLFEDTIRIVKL